MANVQKFYTLNTGIASNFLSGIWMLSRCMKQAGWTYKASSDGVTKDTTGTSTNDKWGGGATPTTDSYPTNINSNAGWWCASGPQVLKIPITSASTGTFVRGEQVSQATSAATGELLGYVFDATAVSGWLVVMPRTGSFDSTHLITGAVSAATNTPSSTLKTFSQEVVFWASGVDGSNGTIYWTFADFTNETGQSFSGLSTSAGCTATVAPGGGGTANAFPSVAICVLGTGGSNTPSEWATNGTATVHALVSAANATPASATTADGSSWVVLRDTSSTISCVVLGLFRLDDTEPGDVCPFEWVCPQTNTTGTTGGTYSRTAAPANNGYLTWNVFNGASTYIVWNGYIARGTGAVGVLAQPDVAAYHMTAISSGNSNTVFSANTADQVRQYNHPATFKPLSVDTAQLWTNVTGQQQVKGRARWLRFNSLGNLYDTTDALTWVTVIASSTNNPAVLIGPWDGATTPTS